MSGLAFPKPSKRPPRSVRAVGLSALEDQADALWSKAIKRRDGHRCVRCGSRKGLEAAHGLPRTWRATRFVLANGVCLCWDCHRVWAAGAPYEFSVWFHDYVGAAVYVDLYALAQSHADVDMEETIRLLKATA